MNMKSINIILSILLASVALSGCAYDRSNKMVKGYKGSAWVDPGKPTIPVEEVVEVTTLEKVAEQAKKQHGLMHVHRYGEGYDILLTLDAGDSDVKFIMELPQSEKEKAGSDTSELSAEEAAATAHDIDVACRIPHQRQCSWCALRSCWKPQATNTQAKLSPGRLLQRQARQRQLCGIVSCKGE